MGRTTALKDKELAIAKCVTHDYYVVIVNELRKVRRIKIWLFSGLIVLAFVLDPTFFIPPEPFSFLPAQEIEAYVRAHFSTMFAFSICVYEITVSIRTLSTSRHYNTHLPSLHGVGSNERRRVRSIFSDDYERKRDRIAYRAAEHDAILVAALLLLGVSTLFAPSSKQEDFYVSMFSNGLFLIVLFILSYVVGDYLGRQSLPLRYEGRYDQKKYRLKIEWMAALELSQLNPDSHG